MISESPAKTKKTAKELGQKIVKDKEKNLPVSRQGKQAFVLALKGDLGSGKTTFLQGFAKGLGIKDKILSPTFNICKKYQIPACDRPGLSQENRVYARFYHFDCYRIKKPKEILDLGFKEIIKNPENIVAIEWPENIKKIIPKTALWMSFDFKGQDRTIDFL